MDKSLAVRQILAAAEARIKNQLANSDYMREELIDRLEYYFSDEKVKDYQIIPYNNGFYLGEIENGNRHGFGALLWYKPLPPNALYIGDWVDDKRNGEGFYLMDGGACYYGGFVNNEFQGNHSLFVGDNGTVEFEADFYKGDIQKVHRSNGGFTYEGKSYGGNNGNHGSDGSGKSGCFGLLVILALAYGIFKCCDNCSGNTDKGAVTELTSSATSYICTARSSLKVRTSPNLNAASIGSLLHGEEVMVYDIIDGFAKIQYHGNDGYVSIRYLAKK